MASMLKPGCMPGIPTGALAPAPPARAASSAPPRRRSVGILCESIHKSMHIIECARVRKSVLWDDTIEPRKPCWITHPQTVNSSHHHHDIVREHHRQCVKERPVALKLVRSIHHIQRCIQNLKHADISFWAVKNCSIGELCPSFKCTHKSAAGKLFCCQRNHARRCCSATTCGCRAWLTL